MFESRGARGWVAVVQTFVFVVLLRDYSKPITGRMSVQCLDDQLSGFMLALNQKLGSDWGMLFPIPMYG